MAQPFEPELLSDSLWKQEKHQAKGQSAPCLGWNNLKIAINSVQIPQRHGSSSKEARCESLFRGHSETSRPESPSLSYSAGSLAISRGFLSSSRRLAAVSKPVWASFRTQFIEHHPKHPQVHPFSAGYRLFWKPISASKASRRSSFRATLGKPPDSPVILEPAER